MELLAESDNAQEVFVIFRYARNGPRYIPSTTLIASPSTAGHSSKVRPAQATAGFSPMKRYLNAKWFNQTLSISHCNHVEQPS